jgi:hypothetical protein
MAFPTLLFGAVTPAQAESIVPSQPILLVSCKPLFILRSICSLLRSLTTIDIAILEAGRITGKVINRPGGLGRG